MFIIGFLEKSFQILWSFLRFSGAVIFLSDSQKKTDYLIPSPDIFLIYNFLSNAQVRVKFDGQDADQNQRFLMTYSSLT